MPIKTEVEAKEARHGQKMIEVKIRFWTDEMSNVKGTVIPKHAWAAGVVRAERNDAHGIKPGVPVPFNSILDIGSAVEKIFIEHGIVLHNSRKMKKYFSAD
jgi:hypothetical protein